MYVHIDFSLIFIVVLLRKYTFVNSLTIYSKNLLNREGGFLIQIKNLK